MNKCSCTRKMAPEILYRVIYGTTTPAVNPTTAILASSLKIAPAVLPDYCRHRVQYADYPGIIAQKGHTVKGTFVTGLTDGDIYRLDRFEGDEYTKEWVEVEVTDGVGEKAEKKRAQTYVYSAGEDRLEKVEWDFEEFRKEKLAKWAGSKEEYAGM